MQPVDAEDVTQCVLTAVHNRIGSWVHDSSKGSFGAWLFKVTRNLAAKVWHERGTRTPDEARLGEGFDLDVVPEPSEDDATIFEFQYRRALFHWAAERIRDTVQEQTWRAFWMCAVENTEPNDVSATLGISMASVYTAKCRVLARIKNEIRQFENEFPVSNEESLG
jgi:RNA polymerase sigma-70 factor (ECF subfamily)